MKKRRVLVLGSGKRVREAALPALARAEELFELDGVLARTEKTIESEGREVQVEQLDDLEAGRLAEIDLVYMVVSKPAVPGVLAKLARFDLAGTDLLLETPVMQIKHFGHLRRLEPFRNVWVSEDTFPLPCFDAVRGLIATGAIGRLERALFNRSAYAYHGIAMGRAVLSGDRVVGARRSRLDGSTFLRKVYYSSDRVLEIHEPRDYKVGRLAFFGSEGSISEEPQRDGNHHPLAPILEDGRPVGFRAGEHETRLDEAERSLMGEPLCEGGLCTWMDGMKRVGFLRLLRAIAEGRGAYPLAWAVEDAAVDYHLERLGRYVRNPLTTPGGALSKLTYGLLTGVVGR